MCTVNRVINDTFDMAAGQNTTNETIRDEFSLIDVPTNNPYLADLEENDEINLEQFEMMETAAFRIKIIDLFKI